MSIKDYRAELTAQIIKQMEEAVKENKSWDLPWKKIAVGAPENPLSGTKYSGMNRLILTMTALDEGIPNKWVTFKQAQKEGIRVKKGEMGMPLEKWGMYDFWLTKSGKELKVAGTTAANISNVTAVNINFKDGKSINKDDAIFTGKTGEEYSFRQAQERFGIPYVNTFTVFNATQLENAPEKWLDHPLKDLKEPEKIEKAENIMSAMEKDGLKIEYGGNRAYYSPLIDTIRLPDKRQFEKPEDLYGTALHEIGHATGHQKRLNREFGEFGDERYAKEELRAELSSYFLAAETGIKFNTGNQAMYLNSWIKALKEDKNEIFKAAKDAGKAVDYIMERTKELKIEDKIEGKLDVFDSLKDAHAKTEEEFKDFLNNKDVKQYTWHGNSLEDDKLYVKYFDENKEIKVKDFRYWHDARDFLEKEKAKISSVELQKDAFSQDLENRLNKSKKLER
jgi:antirestriction protein ArdC